MGSHSYYTRAKNKQYRAAGVLPFAIAPAGQVLILLGRERGWGPRSHMLRWKDFGGHREAIDEDAEATAAREFSEETLGLFGGPEVATCSIAASTSEMSARLRSSGEVFRIDAPLRNGGNYCMFVTRVAYIEPLLFNLATQENAVRKGVEGAEKCGFAWVEAKRLLAAIDAEEAESVRSAVAKALRKESSDLDLARSVHSGQRFETCKKNVQKRRSEDERIGSGSNAGSGKGKEANGEQAFRRSVVAVMVKGSKPSIGSKGGRSQSKGNHKLLLHSSFVCTLRRAQAGGLLEFLSAANSGGVPSPLFPTGGVAKWGATLGSVLGKRKGGKEEREGSRKKRRMSSECLMYWIMHAKKIGALDGNSDEAGECELYQKGKVSPEEALEGPAVANAGQECRTACADLGEMHQAERQVLVVQADGLLKEAVSSHPSFQHTSRVEQAAPLPTPTGKQKGADSDGVARGGRGFLEEFAPEHRSTIAGAFHEAARRKATEADAVVESVLARAALKAERPGPALAPELPPSGPHPTPPLDLPLLKCADGGQASLLAPHPDALGPRQLPSNQCNINFATGLPTATLIQTDRHLVANAAALPLVYTTDSALGGSSRVHIGTDILEAAEGTVLRDVTEIGSLSDSRADCHASTWNSCLLGRGCTEDKVETVKVQSESWEVSARRYAQAGAGTWLDGEKLGGGENCKYVSQGARTAATAWVELERRLRLGPQDGPIAYARFVIEWGSLGDAEKKRRKRRRRTGQGRK